MKLCSTTVNPKFPLRTGKAGNSSFLLRRKVDLISNCIDSFKKMVSFQDLLYFIDDENVVNYVDFDRSEVMTPLKLLKNETYRLRTER